MKTGYAWLELIVIGVQATLWSLILLAGLAPAHGLSRLVAAALSAQAPCFIGLLGFCLMLGVVTDRLATFFVAIYNPKRLIHRIGFLRRRVAGETADGRMALMRSLDPAAALTFIEGIRSRARLLRGALFNGWMALLALWIVRLAGSDLAGIRLTHARMLGLTLAGIVCLSVIFFVLGTFEAGYEARLQQMLNSADAPDDGEK